MKKDCTTCKETKHDFDFNKNKRTKDGLEFECRECARIRSKRRHNQPAYNSYRNAITRCTCRSYMYYDNYGGRGIKVDHTFKDYKTFWSTYGDLYRASQKKYPGCKLEIDRINNDGHYELGNIRFVPREVNQNNRTDNVYVKLDGVTRTITEWCNHLGIPQHTVHRRLRNKWPHDLLFINVDQKDSRTLTKYFNK